MKNLLLIILLLSSILANSQDHNSILRNTFAQNKVLFEGIGYECIKLDKTIDKPTSTYELMDENDPAKFIDFRIDYSESLVAHSINLMTSSIEVYEAYLKYVKDNAVRGVPYDEYKYVYRTIDVTYLFQEDTIQNVKIYLITIFKG